MIRLIFVLVASVLCVSSYRDFRWDTTNIAALPMFNPSVVKHNGGYVATLRQSNKSTGNGLELWSNSAYLCFSDSLLDLKSARCQPWNAGRTWEEECMWTNGSNGVETRGVEDVKLFTVPGRGVFAIYGAKPLRTGPADTLCKGPLVFQQYMTLVVPDAGATAAGAAQTAPGAKTTAAATQLPHIWPAQFHIPLVIQPVPSARAAGTINPKHHNQNANPLKLSPNTHAKEKNWMPLVHGSTLYMVYTLHPTRIYALHPSGDITPAYITHSAFLLAQSRIPARKVHGGPPIVLVPYRAARPGAAAAAGAAAVPRERYLGVMHYFDMEPSPDMPGGEARKHYHHFFFYLHASPPFHICQVSKELLLQEVQGAVPAARHVQYASGLYYDADTTQVLVSYGTGDAAARLMVLSLPEVESMFQGQIDACAVPIES